MEHSLGHHLRWQGYGYGHERAYFITICTQHMLQLFGQIDLADVYLNAPGQMIDTWWRKLPNRFECTQLDRFIVMPNHLHAILWIRHQYAGTEQESSHASGSDAGKETLGRPSLDAIFQWFDTMTTNQYIKGIDQLGWKPFKTRLWQNAFYGQMIRNESEYRAIYAYIMNNPGNWKVDEFNQ